MSEYMNETMQQIVNRKSVRVFENKIIPGEIKDQILTAAMQAPTAGNQILYTILDITDQKIKDKLAVTCDDQPFIAKAAMVLIFLADCRRWYDSYQYAGEDPRKPALGDLMLACQDAVIAAQNTVVAAESFGIGSCYIGDILENIEQHKELLLLDDYVFPVSMLVYGYPAASQIKRKKPIRFDKNFIVQSNRYSRLCETDLRKMFKKSHPEDGFDFDTYVSAFCKRKYMSDFSLEMSRSVSKYLEKFEC